MSSITELVATRGSATEVVLNWDPVAGATQYQVDRVSSNSTPQEFTALATIPGVLTDPAFNTSTQKFVYTDSANAGENLYRVTVTLPTSNPEPCYAFVASSEPTCMLFGHVSDVVDRPGIPQRDRMCKVIFVDPRVTLASPGVPSLGVASTAVGKREKMVYIDEHGYWQVRVDQDRRIVVDIPIAEFRRQVITPKSEGPHNITDLHDLGFYPGPHTTVI